MSNVALPDSATLRWLLWMLLAAALVILDQWSKSLASEHLIYGRPVEVLPVLNMTLHHNSGAAFSFLSSAGGWQRWFFSAVATTVSVVLCVWVARLKRNEWLLALALSLIVAGALGNLWDRLALGYVVDFISVHWNGAFFPTFNVADSAISVGAVLMILDSFLNAKEDKTDG